MAFLLMRDEIGVMNGRPFVWQLGACEPVGEGMIKRLYSSDYLVPSANVPQFIANTMVGRLACKGTVRFHPRCYRRHRIGRSDIEERFVLRKTLVRRRVCFVLSPSSAYLALLLSEI